MFERSTDFGSSILRAAFRGVSVALITALGLIVLLTTISQANAVKMDMTTHDMVIERLKIGLDELENKEAKPGILLRLAELLADRARLKAMDEVQKGCDNCNGAIQDRKEAISYYEQALPGLEKSKQGFIVLQIAHLHQLGKEPQASLKLYEKIIRAKRGTYSSRVLAMAYSSLAETQFRKGQFKEALSLFQKARNEDLKNKAFVQYRIAWCEMNLKREAEGTKTLVRLLSTPSTLATATTDDGKVDPTFADDVSGDLALFLARGKVGISEIALLKRLSPEKARQKNLKILAEETDRLGKKAVSLAVWALYVDEGSVSPMEKLEVQARVTQIYYDMNKQDIAANAYEKTMALWKQNGCTEEYTCDELKSRLKRLITGWNKSQKDEPSPHLLRVYVAYLTVFNDDAEMYQWAAIVGRQLKRYNESADLFHSAAILAVANLKKDPKNKVMRNIFEGSLLAEIEMAEETKDAARREKAYNWYLTMNPDGEKAFEVRYQRAHIYYNAKNLNQAYAEFNWLARQSGKANHELKVKSADLALDILAAMKNDTELFERSQEFAKIFPERQSEYMKISRTATFNMVERKAQDPEAALALLSAANMKGSSLEERTKYLKNKIVLAQKARKLDIVKSSAKELLALKPLSDSNREYALEQMVWVSELQLNFAESYALTQKMKLPQLSPADRLLRLALLADLAGRNPRRHYEAYLRTNRDERANNLVRVSLIKNSDYAWKEIEKHLSHLKKTPDLLAPLALEAFANKKDYKKAERLLKATRIGQYPAGLTLARNLSLKDLWKFDREIRSHRLLGYNDTVLRKSLQERMRLIGKSEKNATWAVKRRDWTLQMFAFSQLARENRRLYNDINALPIPRKLQGEDRERYVQLLGEQSKPYLEKADQLDEQVSNMWSDSESLRNIESVYTQASVELQKLYREELRPLISTASWSAKNRLDNLLNTPYRRPSRQDVMLARRELQANPWDEGKVQALRDLENQSGRYSMVAYLDARLNELKKKDNL